MGAHLDYGKVFGTALVCSGILVFEILSARLLSVVISGQFSIFAIAIAMLGMGAAASVACLLKADHILLTNKHGLSLLAMSLATSYLVSLFLLHVASDFANLQVDEAIQSGGLSSLVANIRSSMFHWVFFVGATLLPPFFIFGLFISVLFRSSLASGYHILYASDLMGAAFGCILAVIVLDHFGYPGCVLLIVLTTLAGAAAFSARNSKTLTVANASLGVMIALSILTSNFIALLEPQPALNKLGRNFENQYSVEQKWHAWNAYSRVAHIVRKDKSSNERTAVYSHQDGAGWAGVPNYDGKRTTATSSWIESFATMYRPRRVLVLFAGVGRDMVKIDRDCMGKCEIVGVEVNRQMVDHAVAKGYPPLKAFFGRPGITLHTAEAREYLERDGSKYDTILLSWWGAGLAHYVGTSGKLAQFLYTKEAFASLLDHLTPNGILIIYNGSKAQTLVTLRDLYKERGWDDLKNQTVIFRTHVNPEVKNAGRTGLYDILENMRLVLKPSGFNAEELRTLNDTARNMGASVILAPGAESNPRYAIYQDIVEGRSLTRINQSLMATNDVELSVITDDRPFIDELVPRSNYLNLSKWLGVPPVSQQWSITLLSFVFVLTLLIISVILIMGPLLLKSGPALSGRNFVSLFYFFLLGAGFMLIEVGFIRKLGLILGHPSYSISVVLAALIFSTGTGSLFSSRLFKDKHLNEKRTVILIALYSLFGLFAYDSLVASLMALPIAAKAAIVVIFLFPLGFLMGQLFPQGLVACERRDPHLVPWAWAINGTVSTVFVGVGYLLGYPFGFNNLIYTGAAIYGLILLLPLKDASHSSIVGVPRTAN